MWGSLRENNKTYKNKKILLKSQQRFRNEKHDLFTVPNKIALSAKDNKIMQSIDSIEIYAYETRKNLICKNEEIKCNNIIKQHEK